MREIIKKVHETSEFRCSAETVFSVLCSEENYEEWYGWPKRVQLSSAEPGFSVGARLKFRSFSNTKIITAFEPGRRLTLDDQLVEEDFAIRPSVTGCTVTYTITLYDEASPIADKLRGVALETLRALKEFTYSVEPVEGTAPIEKQEPRENFIVRLLHGYISPAGRTARPRGDTVTETAAALSGPRLGLGGALLVVLLLVISLVTSSFKMGDVVLSSGLSVYESDAVTKDTAKALGFGVDKDKLEVAINCQGREQGSNYLYYSDSYLEDGEPDEMMIISYDSNMRTRAVAYVDRREAASDYSGRFSDFASLSPHSTIEEVEEMVGDSASLFVRDKSGRLRICFGPVDVTADLFNSTLRSTLVVVLDPASDTAYYNYYGPTLCDNPLPSELTRRQLRQVSTIPQYGDDLAALERALVLPGLSLSEAEAVLKAPPMPLGAVSEEGFLQYTVTTGRVGYPECYLYTLWVFENTVVEAQFENLSYTVSDRYFLSDIEASEVAGREHISAIQADIEILPSHAFADESSVTLGYGHPVLRSTGEEYPLIVKLWRGTLKVLGFILMES